MTTTYDYPAIGCYVDCSAFSADDCNRRTIEFAEEYGFEAKLSGCIDGLRGVFIELTIDQVESGSHQGQCDDDIAELLKAPAIAEQLDKIGPDALRLAMKEVGAWDADELANDDDNRSRALWQACCNAKEDMRDSEALSAMADNAVMFLNDKETRDGFYWEFDDNSLYLRND